MMIMLELQRQTSRLSNLSRKLRLTTPEASRHLQRLSEAGLIKRDADGLYGLTPFGTLVMSQLSGLDFAAKNRVYFMEYDTSCLPYDFISRIGELSEGKFLGETFRVLEESQRRFREAEEFIWVLSDRNLALLTPVLVEKMESSIDLRFILPSDNAFPPDSVAPLPSTMPGVQKRVLPRVDLTLAVTEKHAGFGLPLPGGKLDYRSFIGDDSKFHKWCKDLFMYYWEKAKPFVSG